MRHADTIVAPVTPPGSGPVAVVRVSGLMAFQVGEQIFRPWPASIESHRAHFGTFAHGDEGLVLIFTEGRGYTGEPAFEAMLHGSPVSVRTFVEAAVAVGARLAEPGEFTERAFLNGKLDLSQAEAVRDTITAQTEIQLKFANAQRAGGLRESVSQLRGHIAHALATVEAHVDFSEELGDLDREALLASIVPVETEIEAWLATERQGHIVRHGLRIALVGEPNAGKSSLLNALLNRDRAIVTPVAGTTRDTIEEPVVLGGIPCILIDTAGMRETTDPIEALGVARAQAAAAHADVVWYVHDVTQPFSESRVEADLLIFNKADLPLERAEDGVLVSSTTGVGLDQLHAWVARLADVAPDRSCLIDARHAPLFRRALEGLALVRMSIEHDQPDDLLSVGLREAWAALGEITGETAASDLLSTIFSSFCIGK